MKTISIVAYKRPHYFEQLVSSLIKNDLKDWSIFIQLDPSDKTHEIIEIANIYLKNYRIDIKVNHERLGVRLNPYKLLERVFQQGSTVNIHLEEDIIVAKDVTVLAAWYAEQELDDILCMNLVTNGCFSAASVVSYADNHSALVIKTKLFNSIGLIITDTQWSEGIKAVWLSSNIKLFDYYGAQLEGWDVALYSQLIHNPDLFTLSPLGPRATHIGKKGGEYCTEDFQERAWAHVGLADGRMENLDYSILEKSQIDDRSLLALLNSWEEIHTCLRTISRQGLFIKPFVFLPRLKKMLKKAIKRRLIPD